MTHFLVVGEALIDVIVGADGTTREHVGGSPANVAFGLGRLGDAVTLLTRVGADERGARIVNHLEAAGVEVIAAEGVDRTATATATLGPDGSARYLFDLEWDVDTALAPTADVLHVGSIGALMKPGADAVSALVASRRPSTVISFDPNIRPALLGPHDEVQHQVENLVALSDVVKVSSEDLEWLYPALSAVEAAARWGQAGAALVVMTDGAAGALAFSRGERLAVPARRVQVVDTVGAGDSFMAGLLDALAGLVPGEVLRRERIDSLSLSETIAVLEWAAAAAAVTVSRAGADLPFRADLRPNE